MSVTKSIIVTGASSGIGRATVTRLLENGYRVTGMARDFSKFSCTDSNFRAIALDLSALDALPARLDELLAEHERIDGVVCCAGSGRFGSLEEFSYAQIHTMIELNLTSQIYLVRALLPGMKRQQSGDIVLLGSEAARAGGKRGAVYAAAKFGLRGFTQSIRQECAASGVRVCIINPGMVMTEFFNGLDFRPGREADNYILPEDVAQTVIGVLQARAGTVFDEINLSPQKKVVRFTPPDE